MGFYWTGVLVLLLLLSLLLFLHFWQMHITGCELMDDQLHISWATTCHVNIGRSHPSRVVTKSHSLSPLNFLRAFRQRGKK
ncbi:hypothetical protein P167DRAFT_1936 [Morchella conica CCBAS932]|uniref:Uncharacterized protein n=1 Tax=Morchella conica CCBAS932 TaxID=1392247 RepID=A0A3N4L4Q4_9PEZI|nr:hypothetical protein P167DRAFT_1936 [Morchella conica CCBAS932]